ncbi:MAG: type IV pilus assembly protein PilM [Fimbriimonadales bacterium]|nr:type IV pilus assembly protein PilM [Fimbriimonadales bacterium]MDW8050978.1 type IV pilus assembly protein PilM [Armatimonadota bacterium]
MAKQPSVVVGIDLGSRLMKVAEVRTGRPPTVTNIGIAPTPEGAIDSSGIVDKAAVAAALKRLLADSGISTKYAAFALAGQNSVVVRVLEVPKMSPAELRQHMEWEIGRNIPFADTNVQSAYEVIRRPDADPNADNMEVVLAVAPAEAVDSLVEIADGLKLEPYAIDVEPLALARSLLLTQPDTSAKSVAIVNLGAESTSIDIYTHGLLSFPRVLPIGGNALTRAIADRLMISEAEAEQLKAQLAEVLMDQIPQVTSPFSVPTGGFYTPGFGGIPTVGSEPSPFMTPGSLTGGYEPGAPEETEPSFEGPREPSAEATLPAQSPIDPQKREVFLAIYPLLEELATEIRRSVEYFRSRYANADIHQIILCGGGAALPNLDQYINAATGIPTVIGNPFKGVQLSVKRHGPDYVAAHAHLMAVAVGMGLHASF